jgi:hypothetical protein
MFGAEFAGRLLGKQDLAIDGSAGDITHGLAPSFALAIIDAALAQETSNCSLCIAPTVFGEQGSDNRNILAKGRKL